ncbi:hypothetical protein ARHIZOSPH14_28970 [Agromyces rhizosphaerae]|uniref:Uncharacterized protein n=1 Tax=Agromyces rhizosphaerae TaxID=88374 RepID=A0A9W6CZV0_9MICO|nr:hypothetical protein ARHIZOSPH14_28970 [Agromyces rhizosphaerae]
MAARLSGDGEPWVTARSVSGGVSPSESIAFADSASTIPGPAFPSPARALARLETMKGVFRAEHSDVSGA